MGVEFRRILEAEGLAQNEIETQVDRSRNRILEAPVALILCLDPTGMDHHLDSKRNTGEMTMAVQSVALAGGTILLAAHAEGLGAVWVCAPLFTPEIVRNSLALPDTWVAQGMILLGYPEKTPAARPRFLLDQITQFR
jgi:nitroreductase